MMALRQSMEGTSRGEGVMLSRTSSSLGNHSRGQSIDSSIAGKDEMMDLRKQLQTEAENIARWKASTEVKSKNMERDIQEKQGIIDDQRSNLMELQLHSEHLSQSLFQERQERELVDAKVSHTRQLFLTLQEQYEQLFETVSNFQNIKDEIQKEHDDLMGKLMELKQNFELQEDTIQNMISQAKENFSHFKSSKEAWQKNVMEKDQEIKDLDAHLKNLKSDIEHLSESLENTTVSLSSAENEKHQLCSELVEVKASLVQAQEELKEQKEKLSNEITRTDQELKLKHELLEQRTREFQEAAEKIQYMKKVNDTMEGAKSELTERVTALATRKQEMEEEIKYKEDVIQTLETAQDKSLVEINELSGRLSDVCSQLSIVEGHKGSLELERSSLTEKLQSYKKKLMKKRKLLEQFKEQVTALQSNLEARNEAFIHLQEEIKCKEEINHNLEMSLNESSKKIIVCNDTIKAMAQKLSVAECQVVEVQEEKKKMKEELEKINSDLKIKAQECEDLSKTVKQQKADMETLEENCEVKIKNACSEAKSRRLLEQKINGLEENLKTSMKNGENLEEDLQKTKNLLSEKEKETEELEVSLNKALCKKQEMQCRYETTDQSFQTYKNYMNTSFETLKKELDDTKEELGKERSEHEQQVSQLLTELNDAKETLNSSTIAHEKQLQETAEAFHKEHNTSLAQCKKEIAVLNAKMETMTNELEQAKQEASTAIKDKLQIKLESDNKVKEMSDLLDIYKTEKEAKLKIAEDELQKSRLQITQLMQERDELLAKTNTHTQDSDAPETTQAAVTQVSQMEIEDSNTRIPSSGQYLEALNVFVEPSNPPAPRAPKVIRSEAEKKQPVSGILKTGRRTLLPPEYQKRVVFKPLGLIRDWASGDSSSDACTLEVADSDDPFEEIKRARRNPCVRPERVPRANVAPFISEINQSPKPILPLGEQNMNDKRNKARAAGSSRKKKVRNEQQKQNLKTYSVVSPKNKEPKAEQKPEKLCAAE